MNWDKYDEIGHAMGQMSNFKQCSNLLQLDLITLLGNCVHVKWEKILTTYEIIEARRVILSSVGTKSDLT